MTNNTDFKEQGMLQKQFPVPTKWPQNVWDYT